MRIKANAIALDVASLMLLFFCFVRAPLFGSSVFGVAGSIFVDNMNSNFSDSVRRSDWYDLSQVS